MPSSCSSMATTTTTSGGGRYMDSLDKGQMWISRSGTVMRVGGESWGGASKVYFCMLGLEDSVIFHGFIFDNDSPLYSMLTVSC